MSIPVLITPTLNHGVEAMLASIDHPIDRIVVIDNGDIVPRWEYDEASIRVIAPGHNLGVAASWNLGIKATPRAAWWCIVNDDLTFAPGMLARLEATVEPRAAVLYKMLGYAAFAITPPLLHEVGWFDEGFVNGYDDDIDYDRRIDLAGLPKVEVGWAGTHEGSATIYADPALRAWNGYSHTQNDRYYAAKWGGVKQGGERFATPFDRGGSVADWALDINRLRDQTWPR